MNTKYTADEPRRDEVEAWSGPAVLEFGTNWCGWCRSAQRLIADGLQDQAGLRHVKVEDGPGRPLGRSYRVKLWPTLVFLKDGQEVGRVVRPGSAAEIREALEQVTAQA